MALQTLNTLKSWVIRGWKPLANQVKDWMDSFWHKEEMIPINKVQDLQDILNNLPGPPTLESLGAAPASGSANYIQNQVAATQVASFKLSGNGHLDGELSVNGLTLGRQSVTGAIGIGVSLPALLAGDIILGDNTNNLRPKNIYLGGGKVTGDAKQKLYYNGLDGSGVDNPGQALAFKAGSGTGLGVGGDIEFWTTPVSSTGSSLNTPTKRMAIVGGGPVLIGTDSPIAFTDKLHVAGPSYFTTALRVGYGAAQASHSLAVNGSVLVGGIGLVSKMLVGLTGSFEIIGDSSVVAAKFTNNSFLIGTTSEIASSKLTVESTSRGFLPPRMTTTQRDAIASPASMLQVSNITTNTNDTYDGIRWTSGAKILKASATLDFPSTAAQTSSELTITVTGATVGDAVIVGTVVNDNNSSFTARVSAADTVSVKFNNYSSAAIDPVSGVFNVKVFKD